MNDASSTVSDIEENLFHIKTNQSAITRNAALKHFVRDGYAIYRGVFDELLLSDARKFVYARLDRLKAAADQWDIPVDMNGWAVAITEQFERSQVRHDMIHSPRIVDLAKTYLGPDVAWFNYDALFINTPNDSDPVNTKAFHTDVWTGTGVDTLFAITFLTDVDEHNGLTVVPGSHLQGLWPVVNRSISVAAQPALNNMPSRNLDMIKAGDVVLWHPLLIHATTGHSPTNTRISLTSRLASTQNAMTSQERAFGYQTISVGPMNQVTRLIGNDYLTPFRTLGGYVGVDRRMAGIYDHSPTNASVDYGKFLEGM